MNKKYHTKPHRSSCVPPRAGHFIKILTFIITRSILIRKYYRQTILVSAFSNERQTFTLTTVCTHNLQELLETLFRM